MFSVKTLAGPGYIILNVLRAVNIIALLSVCAASIVMLVKTFVVSKFFFFDALSHVVTALLSLFLVTSESSLFRSYFARNWPLLGPAHGLVALGVAMIYLGINMLGNLNKQATSQQSLGLAFWRIVIASGILAIVFGFANVAASFVFRDRATGITARTVRAKGAIAHPFSSSSSSSTKTATAAAAGQSVASSAYGSAATTSPVKASYLSRQPTYRTAAAPSTAHVGRFPVVPSSQGPLADPPPTAAPPMAGGLRSPVCAFAPAVNRFRTSLLPLHHHRSEPDGANVGRPVVQLQSHGPAGGRFSRLWGSAAPPPEKPAYVISSPIHDSRNPYGTGLIHHPSQR